MLTVLRNPTLLAVSLGHMAVDMFSSSLPILLVVFGARLGLSNVEIGTIVTFYVLGTSLTQPFFGLLADRWDSRWMGIAAVLWQAGGFVLATLLPGRAAFAAFVLAALGSGAYHPHGSLNIRRAAGAQAATATSVFFFFGLTGHALGPVLALGLAAPPFYLLYSVPSIGVGALLATACAGFAIGMPQSVMIVMGQNLFPRSMGFGSGMVLGFFFSVTALAGWLNGWLADRIGLHETLLLAPWLCLAAAGVAVLLPRTRRRSVAVPARTTTESSLMDAV